MADKLTIGNRDKDFADFEVHIHGTKISNVLGADVAAGEVWCHDGLDVDKPIEKKTGTVSIVPVPAKTLKEKVGPAKKTKVTRVA